MRTQNIKEIEEELILLGFLCLARAGPIFNTLPTQLVFLYHYLKRIKCKRKWMPHQVSLRTFMKLHHRGERYINIMVSGTFRGTYR